MNKTVKTLITIIISITLAITLSAISLSALNMNPLEENVVVTVGESYFGGIAGEYNFLALEDIYIPSEISKSSFGLKIYDGSIWHPSEIVEDNPFDSSKPSVFFTHGMGGGGHIDNPKIWYSMNYNVCSFLWGPFADDMPTAGQDKVWSKGKYPSNKNILYWEGSPWPSSETRTNTEYVPDHSITEIYAAYYFDLMNREEYTGSEIRIYGHSLGAQLTVALTNYLIYGVKKGTCSPALLPDRVTLLDPYLADYNSTLLCAWSGENMAGGSAKKAYETAVDARNMGIAFEELRTSEFVGMAATFANTNYYANFKDNIMYSHVDTGFLINAYPDDIPAAIAKMHVIAESWYADMMTLPLLHEENSLNQTISPLSQKEYIFGRAGNKYEINFSNTENDLSDDTVTSDVSSAKICGFIFNDTSNNGVYDERTHHQLIGINVTLLDENGSEIVSMDTKNNGFYSFDILVGKNYKVVATNIDGYTTVEYTPKLLNATSSKDLIIQNIPMKKQG